MRLTTCNQKKSIEPSLDENSQINIRLQLKMHGFWNVNEVQKGTDELTIRRWLRKADCAISPRLPLFFYGVFETDWKCRRTIAGKIHVLKKKCDRQRE